MIVKTSLEFLLTLLFLGISIPDSVFSSLDQNSYPSQHDKSFQDIDVGHWPVLDLSSEESLSRSNAARDKQGLKYNVSASGMEVSDLVLSEESRSVLFALPSSHEMIAQAFPVSESDLVLIGKVTTVVANLSPDGTTIYSEFGLDIGRILKAPTSKSIRKIIIERRGGVLLLLSGKTVFRPDVLGRNPLRIGNSYLCFLRIDHRDGSHYLITAYRLENEALFPVDRSPKDHNFKVYSEYERNNGKELKVFIKEFGSALRNDLGV